MASCLYYISVTGGEKNIGLDWDSSQGPQEYRPCSLPLSYRTTCLFASRYITKYLYPATYTPSKFRNQSRILETEKDCEMFSRPPKQKPIIMWFVPHWAPNVTGGEKKYPARPGFEPRASGIPSLCSTTELPSHMSVCLAIYHQIPVPGYITYWGTSDSDDSDSDSDNCVGCFPL